MPPPAKTGSHKESKHGVKLPALTPPCSPKKVLAGNDQASPTKTQLTALPAGPTVTSAARAVSPVSPPKSDAKKRPLGKLASSSTKTPIAPLDKQPSGVHSVEMSDNIDGAADISPTPSQEIAVVQEPTVHDDIKEGSQATATNSVGAAEIVVEAVPPEDSRENGRVCLIYQQYDELFPIANGSTTQAAIDDVYCLSFVMPNCHIRLARCNDAERFSRQEQGVLDDELFVLEHPVGTFVGLKADSTYYVVVEQQTEQLEQDQKATRELWAPEQEKQKKLEKEDGRGFESCSCIYGNPCVDEYGCRDWHSRFAVATANGWKGF